MNGVGADEDLGQEELVDTDDQRHGLTRGQGDEIDIQVPLDSPTPQTPIQPADFPSKKHRDDCVRENPEEIEPTNSTHWSSEREPVS
jgi:hypothetical protein